MNKLSTYARVIGLIALTLILANCGKSKKNSTSVAAASGYVTCPNNGYYMNNGINTPCTPGTTVYVNNTVNGGNQICPQVGYININGYNQQCVPGQYVNTGGNQFANQGCQQYTQMYGQQYVQTIYQGQIVCMRADLAAQYGNQFGGGNGGYWY